MADSIFTKIIKGEIPCHKIHEDEYSLAFMDLYPIQPGHVLVVPKKQVPFVWDLEPVDYQGLMATVQQVGRRLREVFPEKDRVGVMIQGLDVENHAHIKVFPFSTTEEYFSRQDMDNPADEKQLAELAEKLTF